MAEEEKKEKEKAKKEKTKADKKKKGDEDEEKESVGSKIVMFLVTLIIIAIWLGIFGILIKFDVGGFGSTVLYPILKDVPVLNRILPETEIEDTQAAEESPYDTLDEAVARIKELEVELSSQQTENGDLQTKIDELNSQVSELSVYKEEQASFEETKEKFYEEVVFSETAPDIEQYKTYYESIDPENAAVLYKQVVEQTSQDAEIEEYAATYSAMKADNAAAIFDTMTDNLDLVAKILDAMSTSSRSDILAAMNADTAARLTEIMNPDN